MALRIRVKVRPQAKREEVKKSAEGAFLVSVHAPAREGKANRALIEILADYFSVPKSSIRIIQGETSRTKLVEIG
jgi:uncharacterized protein (TIGR00251 family)